MPHGTQANASGVPGHLHRSTLVHRRVQAAQVEVAYLLQVKYGHAHQCDGWQLYPAAHAVDGKWLMNMAVCHLPGTRTAIIYKAVAVPASCFRKAPGYTGGIKYGIALQQATYNDVALCGQALR